MANKAKLVALLGELRENDGLFEAQMVKHDKDGLIFTIQDASGKKHTGRVHGSGGVLRELKQVEAAIRYATDGKGFDRLNIYEPKPGYVKMITARTKDWDDVFHLVDLKGAKLLASKAGPLPVKEDVELAEAWRPDPQSSQDYNTIHAPAAMAYNMGETCKRIQKLVKGWQQAMKKKWGAEIDGAELRRISTKMEQLGQELSQCSMDLHKMKVPL